jgi:hypothetical protein
MSLYVYCLGDELSRGSVEGLAGVDGAAVRLLSLGHLSALVSETEDEPLAVTDENVLAHNRVNLAALAVSTPLPFRFGTRAERERLVEYAAANEAALVASLARVRGCVEMSVKIRWDKEKAEDSWRKADGERPMAEGSSQALSVSEAGGRGPDGADVGTARTGRGTAFLLAKRRAVLGEDAQRRRAEEVAEWLAAGVSGLVRDGTARVNPSEAIVVRASHLVERVRVGEYRERVRELRGARAGLHFLTSGPWPPYSFSDQGK